VRERTVVYRDDDYDVEFVVRQATTSDGIKRQALMAEQWKAMPREARARTLVETWMPIRCYPSLMVATITVKNADGAKTKLAVPLPYAEFLELPDALVTLWQGAVFEVNPHWVPELIAPKEEKQGEAPEPDSALNSTEG